MPRHGRHRSQTVAFTLVEILVALAVFGLFFACLIAAFGTGGLTVSRGLDTLDVAATTGLVLERLKYDLRRSYGRELPSPVFRSANEVEVRFFALDAIDESTGEGKLSGVTYRFTVEPVKLHTTVARETQRDRGRFDCPRQMVFLMASDPDAFRADRGLELTFAFPQTSHAPARAPTIRTSLAVLNGPTSGAPDPGTAGTAVPAVHPLPRPDTPFSSDGSVLPEPGVLFPPDAFPQSRGTPPTSTPK